jgi:predicted DNA-binding transcriptional regulator AlpA
MSTAAPTELRSRVYPEAKVADPQEWVTIPEAVRLSGTSRKSLYRYMAAGLIPYRIIRRNGRRVLFREAVLTVQEHVALPTEPPGAGGRYRGGKGVLDRSQEVTPAGKK